MKILLSKLKENPLNTEIYSDGDISDLAKSIKEVGLLESIIVDRNFMIISGHRRYSACKSIKLKYVDVIVKDIKIEDSILYIISYNKHRIKSTKELINEIKHLNTYYSKGKGFRSDLSTNVNNDIGSARDKIANELHISSGNIHKLMFIDKNNPDFINLIDKGIMTVNQGFIETKRRLNQIEPTKPITEKITIKNSDNYNIYCKSSDNMNELDNESIQCIFTSPPYWNKRKYSSKKKELGLENTSDEYVFNLSNHLKDCYRVLNKTGSFFLNLGDTYLDYNLQSIPYKVAIELQKQKWILRNTIIWKKLNPKPSSSKTNLMNSYEFIFHFVKHRDYYYQLQKVPYTTNDSYYKPPRHKGINTFNNNYSPILQTDSKNPGDYWDYDVVKTAVARSVKLSDLEHPAPFNEQIIMLPILSTTKENDLVLDPFMGIGTTLKTALKLNRKAVGYDLNKKFMNEFQKSIND